MSLQLLNRIELPGEVRTSIQALLTAYKHRLLKSQPQQVLNILPGSCAWARQSEQSTGHVDRILDTLRPQAGGLDTYEPCVLLFREVEEHTDEAGFYVGHRRYVGAFLHVVLHGSATVTTGSSRGRTHQTWNIGEGDVFTIEASKPHSVISQTLCATACFVVPRVALPRWKGPSLALTTHA